MTPMPQMPLTDEGRAPENIGFHGNEGTTTGEIRPIRALLVLLSYHHKNTQKVADVFGRVLDAPIKAPQQVSPQELRDYELIGFGSGIYDGKHHRALLEFADRLPETAEKKAFLFSTSAIVNESKVAKDHSALRTKLRSKGYEIVDEFSCKGLDTNSFLKFFGGMNKGRPNAEDLLHAEEFARNLKLRIS